MGDDERGLIGALGLLSTLGDNAWQQDEQCRQMQWERRQNRAAKPSVPRIERIEGVGSRGGYKRGVRGDPPRTPFALPAFVLLTRRDTGRLPPDLSQRGCDSIGYDR